MPRTHIKCMLCTIVLSILRNKRLLLSLLFLLRHIIFIFIQNHKISMKYRWIESAGFRYWLNHHHRNTKMTRWFYKMFTVFYAHSRSHDNNMWHTNWSCSYRNANNPHECYVHILVNATHSLGYVYWKDDCEPFYICWVQIIYF